MKYQVYTERYEKTYPKEYEMTAKEFLKDYINHCYHDNCNLECETESLSKAIAVFEEEKRITDMWYDDQISGIGRVYEGHFVRFIIWDDEDEEVIDEVDALLDEMED